MKLQAVTTPDEKSGKNRKGNSRANSKFLTAH